MERGVSDEVTEIIQLCCAFCEAGYELPSELWPSLIGSIGKVIETEGKLIPQLIKAFTKLYFPPGILKQ